MTENRIMFILQERWMQQFGAQNWQREMAEKGYMLLSRSGIMKMIQMLQIRNFPEILQSLTGRNSR